MKLGRLGVWYSADKCDGEGVAELVRVVEQNGYSAYWYPEGRGYESMALASYLLAKSDKLVVGSSIANIYAREPYAAKQGMLMLNQFYGDRFILGLGVSHRPMVEGVRGLKYDKPIATMSAYLDGVHKGLPTGADAPVVVAALGPKMLELSARKTMGAVPYNVTPRHTAIAKKILGPGKVLAVEQKVTIETDAKKARALGRKELARYMVLENYRNNWLREGFSEADIANGGSDRFIDAMCLWGDADTVRRGLRAHFDAGATHVCLQPVHEEGNTAARDKIIETLADV
jgi:probable F420-dependent oxidoreductase